MKKIFFALLLLFLSRNSFSQLNHYASYNANVYTAFFNNQKDKSYFPLSFVRPGFSYRIKHKKYNVVFFYNSPLVKYLNERSYMTTPDSTIDQINSWNLGLNLGYSLYESQYFSLTPLIGFQKNWYVDDYIYTFISPIESHGDIRRESSMGLSIGLNLNVPIYKRLFCDVNFRYSAYPKAIYNKQNLTIEFGFGFKFGQQL